MARPRKVAPESIQQAAAAGAAALRVNARYDAAGTGKRMRGWSAPRSGPNRAIEGVEKIRDRQRDARRNDWAADSAIQKWATTLIGVGIVPRFKRIKSERRRRVITDLWDDWTHVCDADSVSTYYGLQTLGVMTWFDGGECFLRFRDRDDTWDLPVPLQIQLYEADQCPRLDSDNWPGLPAGRVIRQGIEFDKWGRRTAYWFYKEHPDDNPRFATPSNDDLIRVAASRVEHIFTPTRAGQIRGVPLQASVLTKLREIGDFEDAVLLRQKLANLFMAFLKKTQVAQTFAAGVDPTTLQPVNAAEGDTPEDFGLEPGLVQQLPVGWDMQFANPPEAGTTYSDYLRSSYLGVAAGSGIPYELLSGDIKDISDRALRVVMNEFRRFAEQRQWQIAIPKMCRSVVRAFAQAGALVGKITASEVDPVSRAEWAPHGWAHIHPVQDPQGKVIEIDAGIRSRASVIGERGDDPDQVDLERSEDKKRADRLGLTPVVNQPQTGDQQDPDRQQEQQEN